MEEILQQYVIHHRSRERIRSLGEVFTPDIYVDAMLNLLGKDNSFVWSDENIVFFEPCCGHGNIVLAIYLKRLKALFRKSFINHNSKEYAAYYAVANAISTLWAIDIDPENIQECRARLFQASLKFLSDKLNIKDCNIVINKDKEFIAHLLCSIKWQIHENEMLSAMVNNKKCPALNAQKTRVSSKWITENSHNPINFQKNWIEHFRNNQSKNYTPFLFKKAFKLIKSNFCSKNNDFDFAKTVLIEKKNFFDIKEIKFGELWSKI